MSKKLKEFIARNAIEIMLMIGIVLLFIGIFMIYKPAAFIIIGITIILVGVLALKNGAEKEII